MKGELKQDDQGQWWYYPPSGANRKRRYERKCDKCGSVKIVSKNRLDNICQKCAASNIMKGVNINRRKNRYIINTGYIRIKSPDHPKADRDGFILEHRLVMENMIGRYLKSSEVVHHINNVRHDNRPANLWLFSNNIEHGKFHNNANNFSKKPNYIYLAGAISQDPETYSWRDKFEFLMREESLYKKAIIVNPCRNLFNQSMYNFEGNGLEFIEEAKRKSQQILRAKDRQLIKICNLIVVNLALYEVEKPMIGTIMELCWGHDYFYMPIIAITQGVSNAYTNHPWINECVSAKVETVEEAAEMIKTFFLEY